MSSILSEKTRSSFSPDVSKDVLKIDPEHVTAQITQAIRDQVLRRLRRRGAVVGLSGGIDSSVCAALCTQALGPERVLALFMPEEDSDPDSLRLGLLVADRLGIASVIEDIVPMLHAAGCYQRRDRFIRQVVPEWQSDWKCKLNITQSGGYNIFSLVVQSPSGTRKTMRLPLEPYLGIVASTNMKQRTRKQLEYYHADRLNYAVVGTPN